MPVQRIYLVLTIDQILDKLSPRQRQVFAGIRVPPILALMQLNKTGREIVASHLKFGASIAISSDVFTHVYTMSLP